jgi:hypothetical protein
MGFYVLKTELTNLTVGLALGLRILGYFFKYATFISSKKL